MKKNSVLLKLIILAAVMIMMVTPMRTVSAVLPPEQDGANVASDACSGVVRNTPLFMFAFGTVTLNGQNAPSGTVVHAKSPRGDVAGCFVVSSAGNYGTMYIYGEDVSVSPAVPGMRAGEAVSFTVNNNPVTASPTLLWQNDKDNVYQVNLTATSAAQPNAAFTADKTSGSAPLTVQFTNTSTNYTTSAWAFGDGETSVLTSPSHTYVAPGTYTVSLAVTGPGGTDTETKNGYITVSGSSINAAFHANITAGPAPLLVMFTNDTTGTYTVSNWSFGDNTSSSQKNPSHNYALPGLYTVSLTVTGPDGSDTETKTAYIHVYELPNPDFIGSPLTGTAPLTVQFADISTGYYDGVLWDFGDGTPASTDSHPSHTYQNAGTYTVSLTVSHPAGMVTETKTNYIVVNVPAGTPVAAFTADPVSGRSPLLVQFTNQSVGTGTLSYVWNFGDGSPPNTLANPSHIFTSSVERGFIVKLTVIAGEKSSTKEITITVSPNFVYIPITIR